MFVDLHPFEQFAVFQTPISRFSELVEQILARGIEFTIADILPSHVEHATNLMVDKRHGPPGGIHVNLRIFMIGTACIE